MSASTTRLPAVPLIAAGLALLAAVAVTAAGPAYGQFDEQPEQALWVPDAPVHAVAVHAGTVYLGGPFTALTTTSTGEVLASQHLAALDAGTGQPVPGWSASADADVRALAVSADGSQLFAGGAFVTVNDAQRRHLAALSTVDGSLVPTWRPSASGMVRDLLVVGDRLYVGGAFSALSGVPDKGLAALVASTGKRDPAFRASTDKTVHGLTRIGTSLVVAGAFTAVNGVPRRSLATIGLGSGALSSWAPDRVCPDCGNYWDVATDGQRVYVGSSGPGGWAGAYLPGTARPTWTLRADGDVQAVAVADGVLYAGGHFRLQFDGLPRTQLAAVNPATGAVVQGFAPKLVKSYPGVWALASTPDHLHVGGDFEGVVNRGRSPFYARFRTS